MSRNTSLHVSICEAKNLSIKDVSGSSDPYCVIKIDNQVIARTRTMWRTLEPLWSEEYLLHLPNGFHQMSLYVYDEDRINRDDFIGRITLLKEQLRASKTGISGWFKLRESNKNEEIQGELHLEISKKREDDKIYLRIEVIEARELAPKDTRGTSDPFVRVKFTDITQQTQKIKASRFPKWHESMEFEISSSTAASNELQISVWDWDRIGVDNFMGQVVLRLGDIKEDKVFNQWFRLLPSDNFCGRIDQKARGSIRIQVRLHEERILPSDHYTDLIQLLNDSVSPDKHNLEGPTPLKILQEVTNFDLSEMSCTLVKLFLGQGNIVRYLDMVCAEDINATGNPNTLFRGNSLATKSVDQFMKIVGIPYLLETLGPIIKVIYEENKVVELDPHKMDKIRRPSLKMSDEDLKDTSRAILLRYLNLIHENFVNTVDKVPPVMRLVFKKIQRHITARWSDSKYQDYKYHGVSGFLFLRFLVPSILGPKLFFLKDQHPSARVNRTLTLIAKTIQCVGNLQTGVGKEQYLEPLHPFIKSSVKGIRGYIDRLCDVDEAKVNIDLTRRRSVFHPSVVVKQGFLNKKRWCENKQHHSMAFTKRYFWLKYDSISYASKETDQVRTTIPMSQIIAVEFVDKSAFSKVNMGQIITRSSRNLTEVIYFQAKDVNEAYSWVSSLRKMVLVNADTLDYFHPGAFRHNKWTCCLQTSKKDGGCSKTHTHAVLGDWRDPLDPDVEAQTIYSQLYQGKQKLREKYLISKEEIRKSLQSLHAINFQPGCNDLRPVDHGRRGDYRRRHSYNTLTDAKPIKINSNIEGSYQHLHAQENQLGVHRSNDLIPVAVDNRRRHSYNTLCDTRPPKVSFSREGSTQHLTPQDHDPRRRHSHTISNASSREGSAQNVANGYYGHSEETRLKMLKRRGSCSNPEIRRGSVILQNGQIVPSYHRGNNSAPVNIEINVQCVDEDSRSRSNKPDHRGENLQRVNDPRYQRRFSHDERNHLREEHSRQRRKSQDQTGNRFHDRAESIPRQVDNRSLQPEITLFKARSHSDFTNNSISNGERMFLRQPQEPIIRRKSACELQTHGPIRLEDSPHNRQINRRGSHTSHRNSIASLDTRQCNSFRKSSVVSFDSRQMGSSSFMSCGRPPSEADAELSSVAQLLDVISDLERVHRSYDRMEFEHRRDTLRNVLDNSFTNLYHSDDEVDSDHSE